MSIIRSRCCRLYCSNYVGTGFEASKNANMVSCVYVQSFELIVLA